MNFEHPPGLVSAACRVQNGPVEDFIIELHRSVAGRRRYRVAATGDGSVLPQIGYGEAIDSRAYNITSLARPSKEISISLLHLLFRLMALQQP